MASARSYGVALPLMIVLTVVVTYLGRPWCASQGASAGSVASDFDCCSAWVDGSGSATVSVYLSPLWIRPPTIAACCWLQTQLPVRLSMRVGAWNSGTATSSRCRLLIVAVNLTVCMSGCGLFGAAANLVESSGSDGARDPCRQPLASYWSRTNSPR